MRFKLDKKFLLIGLALIFLTAIAISQIKPPIYTLDYHGVKLKFRADLRSVDGIKVFPSEKAVREEIMSPFVENITIVYKPGNETINAHYAVEVFEIVNKLAVAYRLKFGYIPKVKVLNVTSYENLEGTAENPIIALIHPIYSNETSIRLEKHVIYIQAENAETLEKQLKNFDSVAIKFIMIALNIKV
ncbi:MAG: hypothetical protein QW472_05580 [Candidatus Aenigmatarchaeota archaeon]